MASFLEITFRYICQSSRRICSDFLCARELLHFQNKFSSGNRKISGENKWGKYGGCSKVVTPAWQGTFRLSMTDVRVCCFAEETKCCELIFPGVSFSIHLRSNRGFRSTFHSLRRPFWGKQIIVDEALSIKEKSQHNLAFAFVQVEFLLPKRWFGFQLTLIPFRLLVV
jgi:hypothetical protein